MKTSLQNYNKKLSCRREAVRHYVVGNFAKLSDDTINLINC